jgi:hypothetical protein
VFRNGRGDYVHLQGPAPQQLERDGAGYVVASVGKAMPPVAFSSLMATTGFLATDDARAFTHAYRKAREWAGQAPAKEIARGTRIAPRPRWPGQAGPGSWCLLSMNEAPGHEVDETEIMETNIQTQNRIRRDFSRIKASLPIPNLIEVQKRSYDRFL